MYKDIIEGYENTIKKRKSFLKEFNEAGKLLNMLEENIEDDKFILFCEKQIDFLNKEMNAELVKGSFLGVKSQPLTIKRLI